MVDAPVTLSAIAPYSDEHDNVVVGQAPTTVVRITFRGSHNRLEIADGAHPARLHVAFDCDHGVVTIGPGKRAAALSLSIRVGQDSSVRIGSNVTTTEMVVVSATEGTSMVVGEGLVLGYGAVLTAKIPNNCVAVGVPARVVHRDVARERPHLSLTAPYNKPDASTVR